MKTKLAGFPGWIDIPAILIIILFGGRLEYPLGFVAIIVGLRMALSILVIKVRPSMPPRILTYFLLMALISIAYIFLWGGGDMRARILFYLGLAAFIEIIHTISFTRLKATK